jgi:Zn finger protein HypA/HybF involved in hydrogenase expression
LRNCSCSCSDGIIDDVEDIIDKYKAESEDTVNKTGHWIDIMVGDMPAQACDQCNTFYPLAYTGGGHKYCPNCGIKMSEIPTGSESEE